MEHNQQEQRSSAAKDFQESLDQLQHILEENQTDEQSEKELKVDNISPKPPAEESPKFNLAEWEDAVADIDQYFESKDKES
ncbi:MAG: hypothetical protein MJK14_14405 [Rivularia sp. ALOHA_DT_140]|nr:hypothetical protein [Rivularia sp. ALOHA_DT_140]